MRSVVIGIGDCQASSDPDATLVTYALGSCVGLALFDPQTRVGGLLHILLPEASLDAEKAKRNPCLFADSGLPVLLDRCRQLGAVLARLRVWLAGGSAVMDDRGIFNIGKRNQLAMRKALWKAGLMIHGEDLGGNGSRTVRLEPRDGNILSLHFKRPRPELKFVRALGAMPCR